MTSCTMKGIGATVKTSPESLNTVMFTVNGVSARVFCGAVTLNVSVRLSLPTEGHASTIECKLGALVGDTDVIHPSGPDTENEKFV